MFQHSLVGSNRSSHALVCGHISISQAFTSSAVTWNTAVNVTARLAIAICNEEDEGTEGEGGKGEEGERAAPAGPKCLAGSNLSQARGRRERVVSKQSPRPLFCRELCSHPYYMQDLV